MYVCTRVRCDSEHAAAKDNKWSDFSLEGGSAYAWGEGVGTHAGLDSKLLYPLVETTLRASGACGANGGETLGATWQSRPTTESTQDEKLLRTGARDFVRAIVDKITTLVTVIRRGPLRSEHKGCAFGADRSQEHAAEGAVLPFVHKCNLTAAKTISDEMKFGLYSPTHSPSDSTPGDECQRELFSSVGSPDWPHATPAAPPQPLTRHAVSPAPHICLTLLTRDARVYAAGPASFRRTLGGSVPTGRERYDRSGHGRQRLLPRAWSQASGRPELQAHRRRTRRRARLYWHIYRRDQDRRHRYDQDR